jgi:hypothetical protein
MGVQAALAQQGKKGSAQAVFDSADFLVADVLPAVTNPLNLFAWDEEANAPGFNPENYIQAAVPTVLSLPTDLVLNRNFAGHRIYRTTFPGEDAPQAVLAKQTTSPVARLISRELWKAGGGDIEKKSTYSKDWNRISGNWDVNPDVIDYVLRGYSGGVGQFLLNSYTTFANAKQGTFDASTTPVVRRFINGKYDPVREFESAFYSMKDIVQDSKGYLQDFGLVKRAPISYGNVRKGSWDYNILQIPEELQQQLTPEQTETINSKIKIFQELIPLYDSVRRKDDIVNKNNIGDLTRRLKFLRMKWYRRKDDTPEMFREKDFVEPPDVRDSMRIPAPGK